MTREKAIEMCKSIKDYLTGGNPVWSKEEVDDAMTMAIKALSVNIKCRECRHWDDSYIEEPTYLQRYCDKRQEYKFDYEHCSYGERRSDD